MIFRIARHTNDLKKVHEFYVDILGLEKIGGFVNHNGYDGIFIGRTGLNWHLEFTKSNVVPDHVFDEDDILVFYPETKSEYQKILNKIECNGIKILPSKNPYWNENGILIKDFDNHNVIISPLKAE